MSPAKPSLNKPNLIAPCGINCRLCMAYGRKRNPCPGCRAARAFTSDKAVHCSVHCEMLASGLVNYCFECGAFPCKRLLHLDKRYRTRYATSPLDNLRSIEAGGIRQFVDAENAKWACPACGGMLCMHQPTCLLCGHRWRA